MQPQKVNVILQWQTPIKKKEIQAFLGFANYYRRFIHNYSAKVKPLTELTKDVPFSWGQQQQKAFDDLKIAFTTAPVPQPFDRDLETIMETDASNQAIAGVLLQYVINKGVKMLHPVDYHTKTLSATEHNWPIHDKELWAIVSCFRRWDSWLKGLTSTIQIYTDHQGLQYFNTKHRLNSRQANCYLELSEFNFTITYRPGNTMGKPDALICRTSGKKVGSEEWVFKQGQLLTLNGIEAEEVPDVQVEGIDCAEWERSEDGLLIVPEEFRQEVLRQYHDSKVAGHWGRQRTQELVSRDFTWKGWREEVTNYVASCQKCQRSKSDRHA